MCSNAASCSCSLRPRAGLTVAVIGGWAVETTGSKTVAQAACDQVWQAMANGMKQALCKPVGRVLRNGVPETTNRLLQYFFSDEQPKLGVLTTLATAADQIAVLSALQHPTDNCGVEVKLQVIMPFPKGMNRGETPLTDAFTDKEMEMVRLLTSKGTDHSPPLAEQVVWLDGVCDIPANNANTSLNLRASAKAKAAANEMLLQNSDMLVAILDPTNEVPVDWIFATIEKAQAAGMPVVAIYVKPGESEAKIAFYGYCDQPPDQPPLRRIVQPPLRGIDKWNKAVPLADHSWEAKIAKSIEYLMALPHMIPEKSEDDDQCKKRQALLADTVDRLELLYGRTTLHAVCTSQIGSTILKWVWSGLLSRCDKWRGNDKHEYEKSEKKIPISGGRDKLLIRPYDRWYDQASKISMLYMSVYRGFFVSAFLLAAVASGVAVLAMASGCWFGNEMPMALACVFAAVKVVIILFLLWMSRFSKDEGPQEIAADFRYFAELLRPMEWLAPLGACAPMVELPAHYESYDPRQSWTQWMFRAIVRSLPCVVDVNCIPNNVALSTAKSKSVLASAKDDWIAGQLEYQWGQAKKMHNVEHGLEHRAEGYLYFVLFWCVPAVLVLELAHHWCVETFFGHDAHHAEWVNNVFIAPIIVFGALAAILPAVIAALTGILFQSESSRLSKRAESMYERNAEIQKEIETRIGTKDEECLLGSVSWDNAQYLRAVAKTMIMETGDWRALYQTPIHAG